MATVELSAKKVGGTIYNSSSKCYCGSDSFLEYVKMIGRHGNKKVIVIDVPVYKCPSCSEEILSGPVSIKFASRVKEAVEKGRAIIPFE